MVSSRGHYTSRYNGSHEFSLRNGAVGSVSTRASIPLRRKSGKPAAHHAAFQGNGTCRAETRSASGCAGGYGDGNGRDSTGRCWITNRDLLSHSSFSSVPRTLDRPHHGI